MNVPLPIFRHLYYNINDFMSNDDTKYTIVDPNRLPYAVRFNKDVANLAAIADENGFVKLFKTYPKFQMIKEENVQKNCIYDLIWLSKNEIACGGGDKNITIIDAETFEQKLLLKGHTESVKSLASVKHNSNILSSCSRDSSILIYDLRFNKNHDGTLHAINTIQSAHVCCTSLPHTTKTPSKTPKFTNTKTKSPVACIVFQDEHLLVSCGAIDNQIKIWDLRKTYSNRFIEPQPLYTLNNEHTTKGYSNLVLSHSSRYLYANCMNNHIYEFDLAENLSEKFKCKEISGQSVHKNTSNYVKSSISPCDNFLLTGSSDNNAYIYPLKYKSQAQILKFEVHASEVTAVDWSQNDVNQLITCSDDNTIRLWNVKRDLEANIADKCDLYRVKVYDPATSTMDSTTTPPKADSLKATDTECPNENFDLFQQKFYSTKFHPMSVYNDHIFTNYQMCQNEKFKKTFKNQQQITILNTPKFQLKPRKIFNLTNTASKGFMIGKKDSPNSITKSVSKKRTIDKIFSEVLNLNSPKTAQHMDVSSFSSLAHHQPPASKRRLILENISQHGTPVKNDSNGANGSNPNTPTKTIRATSILDYFSPKSQKKHS